MACLKLNAERSSPEIEKPLASAATSSDGEDSDSSAPVVAEFLLALSQSAPSPKKGASSNNASKKTAKDGYVSKGARSARKPFVAHPLPKALKQTRIAPLVFANNLSNEMDDTPLENYFPEQFDTEFAGYEPSDFDIICGRGRGNFSHTGNQKLLDIIRERQEDYLKSNKRGKGALGKQILIEILMNGGRFVKLIDKKRQIWRVLPYKDVNTKIMHCIRDQINFQRKQGLPTEKSMSLINMDIKDPRSKKASLNDRGATAVLPAAKRQKGGKKLSKYLKMKYQEEEGNSSAGAGASLEGVSRAGPEDVSSSMGMQLNASAKGENSKISSTRMLAASLLLGENHPARMDVSLAPSNERSAMSNVNGIPLSYAETVAAKDKHEAMKMLGQFADADHLLASSSMRPRIQDIVAEKFAAGIAVQRAAFLNEQSFAAHARALNYPLLQQFGGPNASLELNQSLLLARAGVGASGFGSSFSDRLRRASSTMPPTADAIVADHIRHFHSFQPGGGVLMNHISSLLGNVPSRASVLSADIDSGITVSDGTSAANAD